MPRQHPDPVRPDPVSQLPAEFRIDGTLGVRAVLRDLMQREVPVSLYPDRQDGGRHDGDFVITRVAYLDETDVELELAEQAGAGSAPDLASVTCVAFPGRVKTQFRLSGCKLLDGQADGKPVLKAPIPDVLWRIQRRDAFRVTPPTEDEARCIRRLLPDGETRYPLVDLSADGAAVHLPAEEAPPAIGDCWPHSRIESASDRIIPCDLIVRHVDARPGGGYRIGLSFRALPSEVQRQVQLYVIDIDKRARRR